MSHVHDLLSPMRLVVCYAVRMFVFHRSSFLAPSLGTVICPLTGTHFYMFHHCFVYCGHPHQFDTLAYLGLRPFHSLCLALCFGAAPGSRETSVRPYRHSCSSP